MKIGNWYFQFYNVKRHKPSINLDNWDFDGISIHGECLPFARADVLAILQMVSNRMSNVVYNSKIEYLSVLKLFEAVRRDCLKIIVKLFYDGYFFWDIKESRIINCDRDNERWMMDNLDVVLFVDPIFKTLDETQAHILRPYIDMLDTLNNADLNLLKNYGAMGVISPESTQFQDGVLDDQARKELHDDYNKTHGITFGKWALLVTKTPVKFTPIQLPIKELEITTKRKDTIGEILQFLNIPKELHALFDSATYANRKEAELDIYGNKIAATAEMMLDLIRKVYDKLRASKPDIYMQNEFWFDIVNVPALQEAQGKEREAAREELKFWQEMKSAMPEKIDYINERIEDLLNRI